MDFEIFTGSRVLVKAWTRGVQVEESAKQQLLNLADMPFIYSHVAAMPDVHWGMGATVGSVIATRGAIIPAAVGVDIGCFVGETKVPLLDGTQATLASLTSRSEPFWVYSLNADGQISPGKARALKTRGDAELMRVVVSGGDEIICTPDHEFMLNDGTYRQARDLKFNDSLMPLYRRWQTRDGYESASTGKGASRQTHVLVWESKNGPVPDGYVVHHDNHVHFDNRPENLLLLTASEHSAHHRRVGHSFDNADPAFQLKRLSGVAARSADPAARAKMAEVGAANIQAYMADKPEHFAAVAAENGQRGALVLRAFNTSPRTCDDCGEVADNPAALRWHKSREHAYNHKVIATETLEERADVYCLQVEDHHNFALAAGVFVHNCGMAAQRTSLTASDLPDSLSDLRSAIEAAVPHGRTDNGGPGDRGAWGSWGELPEAYRDAVIPRIDALNTITAKHPKLLQAAMRAPAHAGTLGAGNHFIEICLDEEQRVWVMLHSGSRGIGNRIGSYFIEAAKKDMERWFISLPDKDLAYIPQGSDLFADYFDALNWAQGFARLNRDLMMGATLGALQKTIVKTFEVTSEAINCFPGAVDVSVSDIKGAFRRWYDGPLVTLRFASGRELPVTPNHPLLTARGWVAAGSLNAGDSLIRAVGASDLRPGVDPDVQATPSKFAELFDSLNCYGMSERVVGSAVDFHGDTSCGDSEVHVVTANRKLRNDENSPLFQKLREFGLLGSGLTESLGFGQRLLDEFGLVNVSGAAHEICRQRVGGSLVRRELSHADTLGFTPTAHHDACVAEDFRDAGRADAGGFGECDDGFACGVFLDEIVEVVRGHFAGHVFNLSTESGWYVAGGIISHNCHHNYVSWERHFGENVMLTRKGAVDAHEGVLGIIPGSMGAKSFIVRGKGNREAFCSCSHGAGRKMSRGEATRTFTIADHEVATAGVECRKDEGVLDETPAAYKDIDAVMAAQSSLVDVVHTLKQVVCVKG